MTKIDYQHPGRLIFVSDPPGLRSSIEIRDHLVRELNLTLRRPGMYGGEIALRILFDHLTYAEHGEEHWSAERQNWEERGAFTSAGVTGAFAWLVTGHYEYGVASVYAEFARVQGWLQGDRTLTPQEYRALTATLDAWATHDRKLSEVEAALGPPSILFGGNRAIVKTCGSGS
jgi:hypothetical protein